VTSRPDYAIPSWLRTPLFVAPIVVGGTMIGFSIREAEPLLIVIGPSMTLSVFVALVQQHHRRRRRR
jgi:hypothetical protein